MNTHSGSCLCGKVSFNLSGEFVAFFLCHCTRCRKITGSAYASNLFCKSGQLKWHSGHDNTRTFNLGDTRFEKTFCITCGAALPTLRANGTVVVPAGCLETEVPVRPNAHIFWGSKAAWERDFDCLEKFEALPPKQT